MRRNVITLLLLTFISFTGISQIIVDDNNNVGIGEDEPVSKFAINDPGSSYATAYIKNSKVTTSSRGLQVYNDISTGSWGYSTVSSIDVNTSAASICIASYCRALTTTAISSRRTRGVWGRAGNATSGWNYGVYGELYGSNYGAAVYAITPGRGDTYVDTIYAGYFRGEVFIEDDLHVDAVHYDSDISLKKDIRLLKVEEESHMDKINTLNPIKYKLKNPLELNIPIPPEVADTLSINPESIDYSSKKYTKDRIGLSAQEVKEVYPELVKTNPDGFLSMDYIGLIPVLVEALKEQDAEIELLKKEIESLKSLK